MSVLLVIGGSKGLGSAFINKLHNCFDKVFNVDISKPTANYSNVEYVEFDLFKDDVVNIKSLIEKSDCLIICAGIGTVKSFEQNSLLEIQKLIRINTLSEISILRLFYPSLLTKKDKYCLVMGSISGELSSPLFATYGASKAAINKICESLNIELIASGSANRITCVKPTSLGGTSFCGGETNLELLDGPVSIFIKAMKERKTECFFEPDICKSIIEKYNNDKIAFGLDSYNYKICKKRIDTSKKVVIGYLSGTFDLFHIGHLNLIRRAKKECDYLIVGVHPSGKWKGKETFIPFQERIDILRSIKYVDEVVEAPNEDSDAWLLYHYDKLFVGSDYKGTERFARYESFLKNKASIIYFEYTKGTSSTQIREMIKGK